MKKIIISIFIILLVLMVGCEEKTSNTSNTNRIYDLTETASNDEFELKINNIEYFESMVNEKLEALKAEPKEGWNYIVIDMTFYNKKKSKYLLNSLREIKLVDDEGYEYEEDFDAH